MSNEIEVIGPFYSTSGKPVRFAGDEDIITAVRGWFGLSGTGDKSPVDQQLAVSSSSAPSRRRRRFSLSSALKAAAKAGLEVARYEIDPRSGKIVVVPGKAAIAPDDAEYNEWDGVTQ